MGEIPQDLYFKKWSDRFTGISGIWFKHVDLNWILKINIIPKNFSIFTLKLIFKARSIKNSMS